MTCLVVDFFVTAPPKKKKKALIEEIEIKQEIKSEGEELGQGGK